MKERRKGYLPGLLLCLLLCLPGCDMFDYHPYDVKLSGERDVNQHNIEKIETNCAGKDTIRFAAMGDTQRWYDETEDFVEDINQRSDIDFVIHGGDMSDFGATDEFLWQRDIMNNLDMPYVVIIGNHDCLGEGLQTYKRLFGAYNFSFIAGDVKFLCLNTNAMEYDYSEPVPDFTFLKAELQDSTHQYTKTVACMHARPLCEQFNNNVADIFHKYLTAFPGLQFCTTAHDHHLKVEDYFGDGIEYFTTDCIHNRSYIVFTITPDNYTYEVAYF